VEILSGGGEEEKCSCRERNPHTLISGTFHEKKDEQKEGGGRRAGKGKKRIGRIVRKSSKMALGKRKRTGP